MVFTRFVLYRPHSSFFQPHPLAPQPQHFPELTMRQWLIHSVISNVIRHIILDCHDQNRHTWKLQRLSIMALNLHRTVQCLAYNSTVCYSDNSCIGEAAGKAQGASSRNIKSQSDWVIQIPDGFMWFPKTEVNCLAFDVDNLVDQLYHFLTRI